MRPETPTVLLILACTAAWAAALWLVAPLSGAAAAGLAALAIAMQASLQHEAIHGHAQDRRRLSAALVFASLNLAVPYLRFRDTHLAHHHDARLTDPYDDPESNYLDAGDWARLPRWRQRLLAANNTLLGRMLLGPALGQAAFMAADLAAIRGGDRRVLAGWLWHLPAAAGVLGLVALSPMPMWLYLLACYGGLAVLKIRTFLEHQAHLRARGRTVIIEDRGPLALLFLNNNLHVVHHMHPRLPWYELPAQYARHRARYLAQNEGYRYASYAEVFRRYLLRAKDPVAHPIFRRDSA